MKRFTYLIILILISPFVIEAQEEKEKLTYTVSGYIGYETYFDTYKSVSTRDGEIYLYPLDDDLDLDGNDINKNLQFQMLSVQSRTRLTVGNAKAFGANIKGVIEGDFLGTADAYVRMIRLRHAFIQMDWNKTQLLIGQTWHPMFDTEAFPYVFSFGAGLPFHPFNRAPQLRFTYYPIPELSLRGVLLSQGYHKSVGPTLSQKNSGLPEVQFQIKYKKEIFLAGITAGYLTLKPRTETDAGYITDETIGSFSLQAFSRITLKPLTIKLEGVYGQNLTHLIMIGGYGAAEDPNFVDDYSYTNINTITFWTELHTNFNKLNGGLFAGYSTNLNANGDYYPIGYSRSENAITGENISSIYRVSPRVTLTSGKLTFILEYMLTGATYGALDIANAKFAFTDTYDTNINHRIILGAKFTF